MTSSIHFVWLQIHTYIHTGAARNLSKCLHSLKLYPSAVSVVQKRLSACSAVPAPGVDGATDVMVPNQL